MTPIQDTPSPIEGMALKSFHPLGPADDADVRAISPESSNLLHDGAVEANMDQHVRPQFLWQMALAIVQGRRARFLADNRDLYKIVYEDKELSAAVKSHVALLETLSVKKRLTTTPAMRAAEEAKIIAMCFPNAEEESEAQQETTDFETPQPA